MKILNSKYKIRNKTDFDVYHFETNQYMLQILDGNDNVIGTLNDLLFTGKRVMSGDISDIKVSGTYSIKGVTGLPSELSASKDYMLQVEAIGPITKPTLINYKIIDENGSIYYKTKTITTASGWSNSGTSASNTMSELVDAVGDISKIPSEKTNLSDIVSDLVNTANEHDDDITSLTNTLTTHNHDTAYIALGKPSDVKTTFNMVYNSGMNTKSLDGKTIRNMLSVDKNGVISLGDTNTPLKINASILAFGDSGKVWTTENDGKGSGLDADKLAGIDSSKYARRDDVNTFEKVQIFNGVKINSNTSIDVGKLSGLAFDNGVSIQDENNQEVFGFAKGLGITTYGVTVNPSKTLPASIRLSQGNTDPLGIGLEVDKGTGDLQVRNYRNQTVSAKVKKNDAHMSFYNGIEIDGKKLYIQDKEPTGTNHPVGSIWIQP